MSMKLHKVLTIGGVVYSVVKDDIRLDLAGPAAPRSPSRPLAR